MMTKTSFELFLNPKSHFPAQTTLISHASALKEELCLFLENITDKDNIVSNRNIVGLGIEKTFQSNGEKRVTEKVSLLKLYSANKCLLVHLIHFNQIPISLAEFLNLSTLTFVGPRVTDDVADLERDYYGLRVKNSVHLVGLAISMEKYRNVGHDFVLLFDKLFSFTPQYVRTSEAIRKSPKEIAFGNWDQNPLTKDQISHASLKVHAAFVVGVAIITD